MALGTLWTVRVMHPSINFGCFRMAVKFKNFYNALPNCLALKHFFYRYAFNVVRFDTVQLSNNFL